MIAVLFVCLGNICRSPMAQAVFAHLVRERGLEHEFVVDSAATADFHEGESPNKHALACLQVHGVPVDHKARMLRPRDFERFDYIFGMDQYVMWEIQNMKPPGSKAVCELFGTYYGTRTPIIIHDPYGGGRQGYEVNYEQVVACSHGLLNHLLHHTR